MNRVFPASRPALLLALLFSLAASAEEAPPAPAQAPAPAATGSTKADSRPTAKKKKGRRSGEKETEGTEALDRFEADTIIKSKYHLDGQPLEVDPD